MVIARLCAKTQRIRKGKIFVTMFATWCLWDILVTETIKQHLNPIFRPRVPKPNFPVPGPFKTSRRRVEMHLGCCLLWICMWKWLQQLCNRYDPNTFGCAQFGKFLLPALRGEHLYEKRTQSVFFVANHLSSLDTYIYIYIYIYSCHITRRMDTRAHPGNYCVVSMSCRVCSHTAVMCCSEVLTRCVGPNINNTNPTIRFRHLTDNNIKHAWRICYRIRTYRLVMWLHTTNATIAPLLISL